VRPSVSLIVDTETLRRLAQHVLEAEGRPAECTIELVVVDEAEMSDLNRRFRDVDGPTDVLSFPLVTDFFTLPPGAPLHLGDIALCANMAITQAETFGHSLEREVAYLFVHGLYHILGYDHESEPEQAVMREKEEAALAEVGLPR
jgi:probable rRNA maturation factor